MRRLERELATAKERTEDLEAALASATEILILLIQRHGRRAFFRKSERRRMPQRHRFIMSTAEDKMGRLVLSIKERAR